MSLSGIERYEPATTSADRYSWLIGPGPQLGIPDGLSSINAYSFPMSRLPELLMNNPVCTLWLALYPHNSLANRVRRAMTEKNLTREGWVSEHLSDGRTLYWSQLNDSGSVTIENLGSVLRSTDFMSVAIISKQDLTMARPEAFAKKLGLLDQPQKLITYYPVQEALNLMVQCDVGILFNRRNQAHIDSVLMYLPWRL